MIVYIGFSEPKGNFNPFAWIIKKVIARPYDHVYIRFPGVSSGKDLIFQASKSMVNLYSSRIFNDQNTSIKEYEINCSMDQYIALWAFIDDNLGTPYSLIEDFGILLMKVFKLKKQPFNRGMSAQFCSKLGVIVCQIMGIVILDDPSTVDPSRLDYILSQKDLKVTLNSNNK